MGNGVRIGTDRGRGKKESGRSMEREDKEGPERVTIVRLERDFCVGKLEDRR